MSSKQTDIQKSKSDYRTVRQETLRDENWYSKLLPENRFSEFFYKESFDSLSLGIVALSLLPAVLSGNFRLRVIFASIATAFALLSVRESKRNREADVAPTLFIGTNTEGDYGILNIGNGPAHELSVKVTPDKESEGNIMLEGEVLRVDDFRRIESDGEPDIVKMEYRSSVGKKYDNVTRKVLSAED